jgi:hypothetical protein
MKQALIVIQLLFISSLLFISCKKNEDPSPVEKIIGVWNFEKTVNFTALNGILNYDTAYAVMGDYLEFRTDAKVYSRISGVYDTATYSFLGNNKIIFNTDTTSINELTDSKLTFEVSRYNSALDFYEITSYFSR